MGASRISAEICPNVVQITLDEKPFIYAHTSDYSIKGWTWFEGVDYGEVYCNAFVRDDLLKAVGYQPALENVEVLDSLLAQTIYLCHASVGQVLFSEDRQMLEQFLQTFNLSGTIEDEKAVAQSR